VFISDGTHHDQRRYDSGSHQSDEDFHGQWDFALLLELRRASAALMVAVGLAVIRLLPLIRLRLLLRLPALRGGLNRVGESRPRFVGCRGYLPLLKRRTAGREELRASRQFRAAVYTKFRQTNTTGTKGRSASNRQPGTGMNTSTIDTRNSTVP
jgi:hypothetical protein